MGLLDQVLGGFIGGQQGGAQAPSPNPSQTQPFGSSLSPAAKAILLVLAAKAWQSYSSSRANSGGVQSGVAPADPTQQSAGGLGGLLGGLTGGGLGGLLGSLGGAGALGGLLNKFNQAGLADQVQSWVGGGQNQPLAPHQLEQALGSDTLDELSRHFQMPRSQLTSELSSELPQAVDQMTPHGRVPSDDEITRL